MAEIKSDFERRPVLYDTFFSAPGRIEKITTTPRYVLFPNPESGEYKMKGGMGSIFRMLDLHTGRIVCAKQVDSSANEAVLQAKINHPGIATVYDVASTHNPNSDKKELFMIQEFVPGELLRDWASGKHNLSEVAAAINQIASALILIGEQDIVHADVNHANIIIDPQNGPRIFDFGIAVELNGEESVQGPLHGTEGFSAPERYIGLYNTKTDLYSLAAIVFNILSQGYYLDRAEIADFVESTGPIKLKDCYNNVFSSNQLYHLTSVVRKGLSILPVDRQKSVAEFNKQLQAVFNQVLDK